jgi:hypothetical protein
MKKIVTISAGALLAMALIVIIVTQCRKTDKRSTLQKQIDADNPQHLPSSSGKTLEMILVTPDDTYKGELKDSLGVYFQKQCDGVFSPEPRFDLVQMQPNRFFNSEMFQKHRNVLIIDYKPANKENNIYQKIDYKSFPQAYFQIIANNKDSLYSLISAYAPTIIDRFHNNEYRRVLYAYKKLANASAISKMETTFKFSMMLSEEYSIVNLNNEFAWFRKDYKINQEQRTQNITIYRTKFTGNGMFSDKKITELRDQVAKKYIAGPTKGSYMGTEVRFPLTQKAIIIAGVKVMETRGLWRLFNDFMGGSFVNYTFYDTKHDQFIMIDCFLYAPNQPKRDDLMQMEGIVHSLQFEK